MRLLRRLPSTASLLTMRLAFTLARFTPLLVVLLVALPLAAYAQAATLPQDPTDLGAMAKLIWDAIMAKQWGLVASLAVLLIVAGLRKWLPEKSKVGAWVRSRIGGIVSNFLLTLAGAFATMFLAGQTFSADMVFKALTVSLTASGGWAIFKNVRDAIEEAKAAKAGADAAKQDPPGTAINQ